MEEGFPWHLQNRHTCFLTVAKSKLIRPAEKSTIILYLSRTNRSADWPTHQNWSYLFTLLSTANMEKFSKKQDWDHDSKKKLLFSSEHRWRTGTEKGIGAQKPCSDMLLTLENKQNILQYNLPVGLLEPTWWRQVFSLCYSLLGHGFCLSRGQESIEVSCLNSGI